MSQPDTASSDALMANAIRVLAMDAVERTVQDALAAMT